MNSSDQTLISLQVRVARNIRRLRQTRKLTQEALAFRARLAVRHIQKLEAGEVNITLKTLLRLATALDADPSQLLARNETSDDT